MSEKGFQKFLREVRTPNSQGRLCGRSLKDKFLF